MERPNTCNRERLWGKQIETKKMDVHIMVVLSVIPEGHDFERSKKGHFGEKKGRSSRMRIHFHSGCGFLDAKHPN